MLLKTNITKELNKIVRDCFPKTNPISKVVNKNNIQVSYSTTANFEAKIKQHNNKLLNNKPKNANECNCTTNQCPLNGKCGQKNVIYQATVKPGPQKKLTKTEEKKKNKTTKQRN